MKIPYNSEDWQKIVSPFNPLPTVWQGCRQSASQFSLSKNKNYGSF